MAVLNLDQKAAEYAQQIVTRNSPNDPKALENLVTKTLGVLQEQGVYAMLLFLYSRSSDEANIAPAIRVPLFRLLRDDDSKHCLPGFADKPVPDANANAQMALAFYSQHVLGCLDTLFLIRELYEQTLIYARFGAKAKVAKAKADNAEAAS